MKTLTLSLLILSPAALRAADAAETAHAGIAPDQLQFFEKNIRRVLVQGEVRKRRNEVRVQLADKISAFMVSWHQHPPESVSVHQASSTALP
jgi:hypothetical protein